MAIWKKDDDNKIEGSYNPPDPGLYKEISKDRGAIPSIISENSEFKGNIKTDGEIQVDGTVRGNITAKQIILGESGKIQGNATASFFRICGRLEGNCRAETIEITKTAIVKGHTYKKTISIEHGAKIVGNINELENTTAKIFKLQTLTKKKPKLLKNSSNKEAKKLKEN